MTSIEKKRLHLQLDILRKRKAKADGMGPGVITQTQSLYDTICADIQRIETQLAAAEGGMAADVLRMLQEIINMKWPPDALRLALAASPRLAARLKSAEERISAAFILGQVEEYREALAEYKRIMAEINTEVNRPADQIRIQDLKEIYDDENPFTT